MLHRRDFLKTALAAGAISARAAEPRPNLLLIGSAPWRTGDLNIDAPNLDRLAGQGIRFDRAYSCCPEVGGSGIFEGRFPWAVADGDRLSLLKELRMAGYRVALADLEEKSRVSGIDFIKQKDPNPFFLATVSEPLRGAAASREAIYYAHCAMLDGHLGRLLAALDEQRAAANTIVVFTSDCGEMLGAHELQGADVPFEESVRVPLIIRHPAWKPAGGKSDLLVSTVDLMPTLLGFCGVVIPDRVQGRDLSSLIATGEGDRPESVYSAGHLGANDEWRMVVRGLDKLVVNRELNVTHLYNLGQDPSELDNRAEDAALELKRDELKALLRDWMRRSGDGMDPSGLKKRAQGRS